MLKSNAIAYAKKGYCLGTNMPAGSLVLAYLAYHDTQLTIGREDSFNVFLLKMITTALIDLALIPVRVTLASVGFFAGAIKDCSSLKNKNTSPSVNTLRNYNF